MEMATAAIAFVLVVVGGGVTTATKRGGGSAMTMLAVSVFGSTSVAGIPDVTLMAAARAMRGLSADMLALAAAREAVMLAMARRVWAMTAEPVPEVSGTDTAGTVIRTITRLPVACRPRPTAAEKYTAGEARPPTTTPPASARRRALGSGVGVGEGEGTMYEFSASVGRK